MHPNPPANSKAKFTSVMCAEQKVEDMKGITVLQKIREFGENMPMTPDYYGWEWGKPKPKILDGLTAESNLA